MSQLARPLRPRVVRIVQNDYTTMLALLFPVVALSLFVGSIVTANVPRLAADFPEFAAGTAFFVKFAAGAFVVGLPIAIWRIKTIERLYATGLEVRGKVVDIWFRKDRGRVELQYDHAGTSFRRGVAVHKTAATESIASGMELILLVDPAAPKRFVIRDLYL